jgi:hypothetical protein
MSEASTPANNKRATPKRRKMIVGNTVVNLTFKEGRPLHLTYPAVVVWLLRDGVAWVQPGYLDPWGATSPQFHRIRGDFQPLYGANDVALIKNDTLTAYLAVPGRDTASDLIEAFAWYDEELARQGRTRGSEARMLNKASARDLRVV